LVHEGALHGEHIAIQPNVELPIVGQATQQAHRYVGVGVNQAGHDHMAAAVHHLGRPIGGDDLVGRPNRHDLLSGHRYSSVLPHVTGRVHGDHHCTGQQNVYVHDLIPLA